jgi:hypothetical protein
LNVLMVFAVLAALDAEVRGFKALLDDIEKVRVAALTSERGEAA